MKGNGVKIAMAMEDSTVYSVWIRRGPDRIHYDLVFENDKLRLLYLGEYWEKDRPSTGLQRSADLLLYSVRKRRRREQGEVTPFDMEISYCDIVKYSLTRSDEDSRARRRPRSRASRGSTERFTPRGILELVLVDGRRLRIEFSLRVYELVKRLVKRYLIPALEKCRESQAR